MRKNLIFVIALFMAISLYGQTDFIHGLDEPNLLGIWGVYETTSSNPPVKFVFESKQALIYEPDWNGDLKSKKYTAFIIGGSITGRYTLHFVGGIGHWNGFEDGWRNYIVKNFNGTELEVSDYEETFTLKLKKDYDPLVENYPDEVEYVDLGLSVLWATSNLGASNPYESGDYYAWGETTPNKAFYDETTYNVDWYSLPYDIAGTQYDPAHIELGKGWHLPTYNNLIELYNECKWEYSERDHGYYVTGPNGNQIFLLLAGGKDKDIYIGYLPDLLWSHGFYMSSSKGKEMYNNYLYLDAKEYGLYQYKVSRGQTIRPVKDRTNQVTVISNDPEGTVNVYNLSGQLEFINVPIEELNDILPKGIHIINGYKLLVE